MVPGLSKQHGKSAGNGAGHDNGAGNVFQRASAPVWLGGSLSVGLSVHSEVALRTLHTPSAGAVRGTPPWPARQANRATHFSSDLRARHRSHLEREVGAGIRRVIGTQCLLLLGSRPRRLAAAQHEAHYKDGHSSQRHGAAGGDADERSERQARGAPWRGWRRWGWRRGRGGRGRDWWEGW